MRFFFLSLFLFVSFGAQAAPTGALHLITYQGWGFTVDSTPQGQRVQAILKKAHSLGFSQVVFNFRAFMTTGTSAEIRSSVPTAEQETEERLLAETVEFAKGLGLTVAFRPILLVIGPKGEFPYRANGQTWWHGNIKPDDVQEWFESYFRYHSRYLKLANALGVEWYAIGAEMHSMTSGRGSRKGGHKYGFPEKWVELVLRARKIAGPGVKITYGINFTDQMVKDGALGVLGGELKQWQLFMANNPRNREERRVQARLLEFWKELDLIGIDYYRALAGGTKFPKELADLSALLAERALSHATQIDTIVTELDLLTEKESPVFLQELGFRAVTGGFLSPAAYEERGGELNPLHQAAAWDAIFQAYWQPNWPWMKGFAAWQVLVDSDISTPHNGFSPLGNALTEQVFRNHLFRQFSF